MVAVRFLPITSLAVIYSCLTATLAAPFTELQHLPANASSSLGSSGSVAPNRTISRRRVVQVRENVAMPLTGKEGLKFIDYKEYDLYQGHLGEWESLLQLIRPYLEARDLPSGWDPRWTTPFLAKDFSRLRAEYSWALVRDGNSPALGSYRIALNVYEDAAEPASWTSDDYYRLAHLVRQHYKYKHGAPKLGVISQDVEDLWDRGMPEDGEYHVFKVLPPWTLRIKQDQIAVERGPDGVRFVLKESFTIDEHRHYSNILQIVEQFPSWKADMKIFLHPVLTTSREDLKSFEGSRGKVHERFGGWRLGITIYAESKYPTEVWNRFEGDLRNHLGLPLQMVNEVQSISNKVSWSSPHAPGTWTDQYLDEWKVQDPYGSMDKDNPWNQWTFQWCDHGIPKRFRAGNKIAAIPKIR